MAEDSKELGCAEEMVTVQRVSLIVTRSANDDQSLVDYLNRYLTAFLLKVESRHGPVRAHVIKFAQDLKPLLAPPGIICPVDALMDQMIKTESPILKLLDTTFIRHSLPRLVPSERNGLLQKVLLAVAREKQPASASSFFNFLLRILPDVRLPPQGSKEDLELREKMGFTNKDAETVVRWLGRVLLLRMPVREQLQQQYVEALNNFEKEDLQFLKPWAPEMSEPYIYISQLKFNIMNFLRSGIFTDGERFLPALYASSNIDTRVAELGNDTLKKTKVNLENEELARALWDTHSALGAPHRTRILGLLLRSDKSTTMSQHVLRAVERDLGMIEDQESSQISNLERYKLHVALFEYIKFVAAVAPTQGNFEIGPRLIEILRRYIEIMGWPSALMVFSDDIKLRSSAYEIIGILGQASKMEFEQKISLADWLFKSLAEETAPETVVDVEGALSMLSLSFKSNDGISDAQVSRLITMLLGYMGLRIEEPIQRSVRHVVVKWANRCLPFYNSLARWIDILALVEDEEDEDEVQEEGENGLDPCVSFTYAGVEPLVAGLPNWKVMVSTCFGPMNPCGIEEPTVDADAMDIDTKGHIGNFGGNMVMAYPQALQFCIQMMLLQALNNDALIAPGWADNLNSLLKTDVEIRHKVTAYLKQDDNVELALDLLNHAVSGVLADNVSEIIVEKSLRHAVSLASVSPANIIRTALQDALPSSLRRFLLSPRKETRVLGAELYGILLAHPESGALVEAEIRFIMSLINPGANQPLANAALTCTSLEGGLLAYGHLLSRMAFYGRPSPVAVEYSPISLLPERPDASVDPAMLETVMDALSNLWTVGLCLPNESDEQRNTGQIITSLVSFAKQGKEKAVTCLGRLALALGYTAPAELSDISADKGLVARILVELFQLHELKQIEVHFAIGEALAAAVAGWEADCVKLLVNVDSAETAAGSATFQTGRRPQLLEAVLTKLITDSKATKPSLLKASGIWLFSLVQYCAHVPEVHARLREAQASFMRLLSAREDVVQETASRGLTLVYEKGDEELRGRLVDDLVGAFTGTAAHIKVDEDTELFDVGALPTGNGQSVTSYKDIVNLASEVGDQTLVYKFMSLAANATMWSTRSAFGRFGLSSILVDTEVDPRLYPKLFRYRFDPNPNVRRSMNEIWKAMVKEPNVTIDTHFTAIMQDLLISVVGREWRVREASCAALADLIQGRQYSQYAQYYSQLWTVALKVIDDVKGSVRKAALNLCMTLSNTLVRTLENSTATVESKKESDIEVDTAPKEKTGVQAMMDQALEFLLSNKGTDSSVKDVQIFATLTLLDVCNKGGRNLRPYTPDIVPHLLGLLSTLEPDVVNYAYQRVSADTKERLDKHRAQNANHSPLTQAIENCLRFADVETVAALCPKLEATIKNAVGMPTKIGCGRVLGTLFTRHADAVRPFMSKLLTLLLRHLLDPNDEVSKSYARAAAYGMRVAGPAAKKKFCTRLMDYYFDAEDEHQRRRVADAVLALSKTSPDEFGNVEAVILPFVFFGASDVDAYSNTEFAAVWSQNAGSSRTIVRYVPEVVALAERALETNKWDMHHTAAFAIGELVVALGRATEATGQISDAHAQAIWPVFDQLLALKSFDGKERVLESFPIFVKKARNIWVNDAAVAERLHKIAMREAKRNSAQYRPGAFTALWKFAQVRKDLDMFNDITAIVTPYLQVAAGGDQDVADDGRMDIDDGDAEAEAVRANTVCAALSAIARGYNPVTLSDRPWDVISSVINHIAPFASAETVAPMRRHVWYEAVAELLAKAVRSCPEGDFSVAKTLLGSLDVDKGKLEVGTESQRGRRVEAVLEVVEATKRGVFGDVGIEEWSLLKSVVDGGLENERGLGVKKKWQKVAGVVKQVMDNL